MNDSRGIDLDTSKIHGEYDTFVQFLVKSIVSYINIRFKQTSGKDYKHIQVMQYTRTSQLVNICLNFGPYLGSLDMQKLLKDSDLELLCNAMTNTFFNHHYATEQHTPWVIDARI